MLTRDEQKYLDMLNDNAKYACLPEQRSNLFYECFDHSVKEAKQMIEAGSQETTLGDLIGELERGL